MKKFWNWETITNEDGQNRRVLRLEGPIDDEVFWGDEVTPEAFRADLEADTGDIELWIDLGQPDESRIRKASSRARQVVVVNYSGNAAAIWWDKNANALGRLKNLTVVDLDPDSIEAAVTLLQRSMRLTAMIQDGELQLMS